MSDRMAGTGSAGRFYAGDPEDLDAYRTKADALDGRFDGEARRRAAQLISSPFPEVRHKLDALVRENGFFVTTGQQPGLFTGPLFSIYKAVSAIRRAEALEASLGRPVIPLFWIASEDHDWGEMGHTYVVDLDNDLRKISVPIDGSRSEAPVHRVRLAEDLESARSELEAVLPETDFSGRYLELLKKGYASGATLASGFRHLLEQLLGPMGLCFVEAHDIELKRASVPTLVHELDHAEAHEERLRSRADELAEAGYHVQVPILEGGVNLFLERGRDRERLYRDGEGFSLRHSEARLDREAVLDRLQSDPQVLSPNVLLRPVVESALFPTLAYVAGPGEMAYFAQLPPLFEAHGIEPPLVAPRRSFTIVEKKNLKVLEKFDLSLDALDRPFHEIASAFARDELPADVRKALGAFRGAVGQHGAQLLDAARAVDPTLKGPVEGARNSSFQALDEVEKKIVQAVKRQSQIGLSQIEKAQIHLRPLGGKQDRALNVLYFLVRYGDDFLSAVADRCSVDLAGKGL